MGFTRRDFIQISGLTGVSLFLSTSASSREVARSALFNNVKSVSILGDSITHGAFAGDLYRNGWANLLSRSINAEYGSHSYGFTPFLTLGEGDNFSFDVAEFTKSEKWIPIYGSDASNFISGFGYRSSSIGSYLSFKIPSFMSRVLIHYISRNDGADVDVFVNGISSGKIQSRGEVNNFSFVDIDLFDDGSGYVEVKLVISGSGYFDFSGISYLSSYDEIVCNNYSVSGRRFCYIADDIANVISSNSRTIIFALGHNDSGETDPSYQASFKHVIDTFIDACNKNKVDVIVPDFVWTRPDSNWVRVELRRLAEETSGLYINLPKLLEKSDGVPADLNHLVNTLGMWVDSSHPNEEGNKWIFEEIAKAMNLSCQTKEDALTDHDFNFPPKPLPPEPEIPESGNSGGSIGLLGTAGLLALGAIKAIRTRD
ncbi:TPA: SGNH/GDSL hydrolase family protein [Vibrio parahaemolyticus]|nr:SGNH/GDSL hydrolase family protein [Vibrio parahaemolyticus]